MKHIALQIAKKVWGGGQITVQLGLITQLAKQHTKSSMQMLVLQWTKNAPERGAASSCDVMMSLMISDILLKALERSLTGNLSFKLLD